MKRLLLLLFVLGSCLGLSAQRDALNTQFMYNKIGYNPGFAGAKEATCLTAIYRNQWIGLEGAPTFQAFNANIPLVNQRVGVGLNIQRHTVGITESYQVNGIYAYRIRAGRGDLGIGVQAGIGSLSQNWRDSRLTGTQPLEMDQAISSTQEQKFLFNFGTGLYYKTNNFFFGVSAPRLLRNSIDFTNDMTMVSREVPHFYMMGGYAFSAGEGLAIQPQFLLRYVDNAPLDADLNISALIQEVFIMGLTYRLGGAKENASGESLDVILALHVSDNLMFGVSYDFTLTDIRNYSSGSVEVAVQYCIGKSEGDEYINPRFF